eukprot:Sspe_Gene.47851::Locus_24589_Transcript_1_1_Confidence_1.000_Length_810::g.47851::m.47851
MQAPMATPISREKKVRETPLTKSRKSLAPGVVLPLPQDTPSDSPTPMKARKSVAPRMSIMPCAPLAARNVNTVCGTEFSAIKAENNRLKQSLEKAQLELEEERKQRQHTQNEYLQAFKKAGEAQSKVERYQREASRYERRVKRDEEIKAKHDEELQKAVDNLQSVAWGDKGGR